jgi:VWFA-related protein
MKLLIALAAALSAAAAGPQFVSLNVIATDSHGQPVADLSATDIQISDNGKVQEIAFFHPAPSKLPHSTLILFDLLNSNMTDRGFSSTEIARNLQNLESPGSVYFYLLTKDARLYPVRPLPNGPADSASESAPWTKDIKSLLDKALQQVNKLRPGDHVIDTQVKQTYNALNQVVSTIALMPGRNSVVWISHGVPLSVRLISGGEDVKYTSLLKQLAIGCDRARTTFYTVDPTGATPSTEIEMSQADTLQQIANLTGGQAWRGDDVAAATRFAMNDSRANYRVAYMPTADPWDGKPHRIKVSTARKGVNLIYKQTYYADTPVEGEADRAALQSAVSSPYDNSEIAFRASYSSGKVHLILTPSDVMALHNGDRYTSEFDIALVQYGPSGPKSISKPAINTITLTQAQYETAQKNGIAIDQPLQPDAEVVKVRAIVYDRNSGLTGSLTIPIK